MRRIVVLLLGLAVALALVPGPAGAAKKCKQGRAIAMVKGKSKCVKKCPKGQVKKRVGKRLRCVKPRAPTPTDDQSIDPVTDPGTDPGTDPVTDPGPTQPAHDPLAKFTEILRRMYLLRNYQVQNGSQTNNHSDEYEWCDPGGRKIMGRKFESLSYIYTDYGPYEIIQGEASADGTTGSGVLRYTKEYARPDESEVGEVHDIQISWQGDTATVINPDTYSTPYAYAKSLRSSEACSG